MPVLPEYGLTGKTAILATSGGREAPFLGQALVEAGASVFAVARTQTLLDAVLASLPPGSGGAVMDAGVPDSAKGVMEQFDQTHDKVDILVNDPRSMYAKPLEEISAGEWDAVQTRNAKAP
ncbi:MAG: SDR family NAD(P)-dependent oxidoreductase, partial [Chloroflexi bacterium]|nr:SDR family NAD(P)-dependent oxidoreductase [Chloroflexota bacterium]